jgi:hypothetical protein
MATIGRSQECIEIQKPQLKRRVQLAAEKFRKHWQRRAAERHLKWGKVEEQRIKDIVM